MVAALGEQMLRVTAAMADGTLTWCGPATLASHTIPTINRAAEEFGRPAPRVIAALPVCVTADKDGAAARAAQIFAAYGAAAELPGDARPGGCDGALPILRSSAAPPKCRIASRLSPGSASPISRRWSSAGTPTRPPIPAKR